eukprot:8402889-Ditylum_brightwellii.AAC.1
MVAVDCTMLPALLRGQSQLTMPETKDTKVFHVCAFVKTSTKFQSPSAFSGCTIFAAVASLAI